MSLPKTPASWANSLSGLVYAFKDAHELPRFPIDVKEVAREFSRKVFPKDPITRIDGAECEGFEGMLVPVPGRSGEWGIIYNNSGSSEGRVNFSIAHEFGHYLLHRQRFPEGKKCTNRDMMDWSSEEAKIEGEANNFAANVLMPLDDFREQVSLRKTIDLFFFDGLTERYKVSVSAAILRWLGYTNERAMIVVGKDGFIDWAWSSKPLLRSGIYYRAKQETIELPSASLAALRDPTVDNKTGIKHPSGVWPGDEQVTEMTILTSEYCNMSISLLKYPKLARGGSFEEEEHAEDTVDHFERRFRR